MTKREIFENILQYVETGVMEIDNETLRAFACQELSTLDKRNASSKKRSEAKKEAGDLLTKAIQNVLTAEPQTAEEILTKINIEDTTATKIQYHIRKLINSGVAQKEKIFLKSEDTNRRRQATVYSLS